MDDELKNELRLARSIASLQNRGGYVLARCPAQRSEDVARKERYRAEMELADMLSKNRDSDSDWG